MPRLNRRALIRLLVCAASVSAGLSHASSADAGEDDEHESARRAVERGEALPLAKILAMIGDDLGGEITRVSFEREDGVWVYELKVVDGEGRLVEIYVDAASGRILKREGG